MKRIIKDLFRDKTDLFLVGIIVICFLFLVVNSLFSFTGSATSGSTPSNVSVSKYLAISLGANLSEGIQFGTVAFLPVTDLNASHNNDSNDYTGGTTYTIDVSTDSNTEVDFCILANAGLTSSDTDVIGLANETYSAYNLTNVTHPDLSLETSLTQSYVKAVSEIAAGNSSYWRFWLDIPAAQPSGDYNNTVSFEGVTTGLSC